MTLAGFVTGKDISGLTHDSFRKLVNTLLTVEAAIHGVPPSNIDLSTRDHDKDAGIDARITWLPPSHNILPQGEIVVQYKSGELTKKKVETEFNKRGVQSALASGAHYRLLVARDYADPQVTKYRSQLAEFCKSKSCDPSRCEILFGGHIAQWVCQHPAVMIMPELGKPWPPFVTVREWQHDRNLRNPWTPDEARLEITEKVRSSLRGGSSDPVTRIEGGAGVGKTRVALELLREPGFEEWTIYAPNAEAPGLEELLGACVTYPGARAIVVADECDRDRQDILRKYPDLAEGRLRLLCLGPSDPLPQPSGLLTNVFVVPRMSDAKIREALLADMPGVPQEIVDTAVRLAGGYVKLAFFLAHSLLQSPGVSAVDLRGIPDVSQFLKKFMSTKAERALQVLSIFGRLGWEGEVRQEAEAVSKYLEIPFTEFEQGVAALKRDGVVVPRGRYLYVTPELLAYSAAAELWETKGHRLIEIMSHLPRPAPRVEVLKRLAGMGQHPEVRRAVETLLGDNGLFRTLGDFDDEFRSELFRILSSALPRVAVEVLERILLRASEDDLRNFKIGRRDVVWAIEVLLRWPETSIRAARCLRALALSENESIGNNATAVFEEYFHVHLSRSPIPFVERLVLLEELIKEGDACARALAVGAAKSALVSYETRMGGNVDELAVRPYPSEWRPKTYEELRRARMEAVEFLKRIAQGRDVPAKEAHKAAIESVFTLMQDGLIDDLLQVLNSMPPETDEERRTVLDNCQRVEKQVGNNLTEGQRDLLKSIASRAFGQSYFERLRRWIGPRPHSDFEGNAGFAGADSMAAGLADEAIREGISNAELTWLASPEAENVWDFGLRLGELDKVEGFLKPILSVTSNDINTVFLASYLNGRSKAAGEDSRERILDDIAKTRPLVAVGCTWRGNPAQKGLMRVLRLVESGVVPPEALRAFMFGGWTKPFGAHDITQLVSLMMRGDRKVVLEPALHLLDGLLNRSPEALDEIRELVWAILEATPPEPPTMVDWYWGRLARRLVGTDPVRMAEMVIRPYTACDKFIALSDDRRDALVTATQAAPQQVWNIVAAYLIRGGETCHSLLITLQHWYGSLIPTENLIGWAKQNQPLGPTIAAALIGAPGPQLSNQARALILAFKDNRAVRDRIYGSLRSGVSVGPYSNRIERDLSIVKNWANDSEPVICSWAQELVQYLEKELQHQRVREAEGEF